MHRFLLLIHKLLVAVGAAIVLLSAQERASFDAEPEQAALATSWQRCLGVLGHYKQRIGAAHQAIRVLESLRHELMSRHAKVNGTVDPERSKSSIPSMLRLWRGILTNLA